MKHFFSNMNRKLFFIFFILFLPHWVRAQLPQKTHLDTIKAEKPYEIRPPSNFSSTPFQNLTGETQSTRLDIFGYDLFNKNFSDIQTSGTRVLPPQYRLGPGDKLGIYLLGNVQEAREVLVNVEGKIFVPPVGVLFVWGLSMDELKKLMEKKLAQFYDNFTLDLMLLQPKNVLVSVVGEVNHPGKYILSALNTVLDAVIRAGGPTANGSLRDIQLIRDGTHYASVDFYQFLMSNKQQSEIYLEAGDRIFVPLAKKKVKVEGEVYRPFIFELKPGAEERLSDVIHFAGGLTDLAYRKKIEISRLENDGHRRLIYVNFDAIAAGDSTEDLILHNQDRIKVYSKLEQIHQRTVSIYGEIRRPGKYRLEDNMHLSDLILKAGNLTRKAYTLEAEIAKVDPGQPTRFVKVNLDEVFNASDHTDILLEEDDQVFIRQIPEWEVGLMVEVRGEVKFPGKYSIVKDSTRLSEIIHRAGGFTEEAFLQEAYVIRPGTRPHFDKEFERLKAMRREEMTDLEYQYFVMKQNSENVDRVVVNFEKLFYQNDLSEDIILEDGDIIVIPKKPKVVTVTGQVAKPGGVPFQPGASLDYYVSKAGGPTWDANTGKTKIIKVTGEVLNDEDVKEFMPGDIIWVPRKEDKSIWPVILQSITVTAQLASIYLIIDTAINR